MHTIHDARPAVPAARMSLVHGIARLLRRVGRRARNARLRHEVAGLATLDDAILRDIGLTRDDLYEAAHAAPDTDPTDVLTRRATARRTVWRRHLRRR